MPSPNREGIFAFRALIVVEGRSLLWGLSVLSSRLSTVFLSRLDWADVVLYGCHMTYSTEFATTLATIAAKAQSRWAFLTVEIVVDFAWFSVNTPGDASIDDDDLQRHFEEYLAAEVHGVTLPAWMIGR